jgi:hypothetical protein
MPPVFVLKPFDSKGGSRLGRARASFEISLVRPSMRRLAARRNGCTHCRRTPLVGEMVFFYGDRLVCALCRPLRREPPGRAELVYSSERDHTVKARRVA